MTSSTSSSSKGLLLVAALAAATMVAGCASARPKPAWARGRTARVAVFPPENLTGGVISSAKLLAGVEIAAARAGLDVVAGAAIDEFLAAHRIRYTGGVDREAALAAQNDLGVDAVLITSVESYSGGGDPTFAATLRLVSAGENPEILWIDGVSQAGSDTIGLLGLGGITTLDDLEQKALGRVMRSLAAFLGGGPRAHPCEARPPFRPKLSFQLSSFELGAETSIAVLPFVNETKRTDAGEVVALHYLRQLAAIPGIRVIEPGIVRRQLLDFRLIMPGGVSLDQAGAMLKMMHADLVVAGYVRRFDDGLGVIGVPRIDFTTLVLDRLRETIVWESTSYGKGNDGVVLFDFGKVSTPSTLVCAMTGSTVSAFHEAAERGRTVTSAHYPRPPSGDDGGALPLP
jgi:hypothetical protein